VGIGILSTQTAYAATSCHINGSYEYGTVGGTGTTQDPSKIYQAPIKDQTSNTTGVGIPDYPTSATALGTQSWQ
jgi:hypothetical protein